MLGLISGIGSTNNFELEEVNYLESNLVEQTFLETGYLDRGMYLDFIESNDPTLPSSNDPWTDQDKELSLLSNELEEVCFQCSLPGRECYTYPYTCFPGSSY